MTEIVVKDIKRSTKFYRELGFEILRDAGDFVELTWEDHQLYIAELSAYHEIASDDVELPEPPKFPLANIRIMVPNVDDYWKLVKEMGAQIVIPIADRYYGLRDFIILIQMALVFASRLHLHKVVARHTYPHTLLKEGVFD